MEGILATAWNLAILALSLSAASCRLLDSSSHGIVRFGADGSGEASSEPLVTWDASPSVLPSGVSCRAVPDPGLQVPPFVSPYTAPDIPLDYRQQPPGHRQPEQVALFPATRNGSIVFVRFLVPGNISSETPPPTVSYGVSAENLDRSSQPLRSSRYTFGPYSSGTIHFATMGPLLPATLYFYKIQGRSQLFHFTSLPAVGPSATLHLALVGDVGQTLNSSSTLQNVLKSQAALVLFAGDLSYADHYGPPCQMPSPANAGSPGHAGGQERGRVCGLGGLRWDSWGRMSEDALARKIVAYIPGNHELEYAPSWGEISPYKAYRARVPAMLDDNNIERTGPGSYYGGFPAVSPLFYSLDAGPVHIIGLSSYSPFIKYSHQWYWLLDDLCAINRQVTPWVLVFLHVPLYNSNIGHYREGEAMRTELEDFLHEAGVDLVVAGHVHAYERSFPVHRMRTLADGCGAIHVTVGDGGNIEEVSGPFVEPQPSYSAYREESFGHAELVIKGPTSATYMWYRNQDGTQVLADKFDLVNHGVACNRTQPSFCRGGG